MLVSPVLLSLAIEGAQQMHDELKGSDCFPSSYLILMAFFLHPNAFELDMQCGIKHLLFLPLPHPHSLT